MELSLQIDLHVHSEGSSDGHEPVEEILAHAADIGLDGVVVTDHDSIDESLRAAALAPDYGLVGIPGVEVSTAHGHLLAIGVTDLPPRGESYEETVSWIRAHGGVAIVPHPFQRTRHGVRKRDISDVDAVETFNAWLFTGYKNQRARRFAAAAGYPTVAASDAHTLPCVGRAYTEITVEAADRESVTAADVCAAIREGATAVEGRRAPIPMAARHYAVGAARTSGSYARVGTLKGGSLAKLGVRKSVRGVSGLIGAVR